VNWPGRLQLITRSSGQRILLDGAHNVAGAQALRAALMSGGSRTGSACRKSPGKPAERVLGAPAPVLIFGALADKNWAEICRVLAPLTEKVFTVPVASDRTASAGELAAAFRAANPKLKAMAMDNLAAALGANKDEAFVVITGSLYLVGEVLELLDLSPAGTEERGLNEWTASQSPNKPPPT
jgi:dihydrofolate synthase/folylpolyglutamate synthase